MGKIVVHNLMSLDGYYAGPNEQVDAIWEFNHPDYKYDRSFHYANIDLLRSSSALLIGKKTFLDKFNVNWKDMIQDPQTPFFMRDLANQIDTIEKIVVSNSLTIETLVTNDNTKIIKREKIIDTLADLKQKSEKNIAIIGSRTLWQDLLTYDLIDELQLTVAPVFSGTGTLLFDHQPGVVLKRLDTRVAEGNIMLVFQVSRNKPRKA